MAESLDKKMDKLANSLDKGVNKISIKFEEKIATFDEENFEEKISIFFVKCRKDIATFFTLTIPQTKNNISKLFESRNIGIIAGFLILIITLVIIVAIASCLQS